MIRHWRWLGLTALGIALALINDLPVLSGYLYTPPGYVPLGISRLADFAQYVAWARGSQHSWLLPDYHAPWLSEPALFSAFASLIGRTSLLTGVDIIVLIQLFHLSAYILAVHALWFCITAFVTGWRQRLAVVLVAVAAVPLKALAIFPWILSGPQRPPNPPGLPEFVLTTSDGLLHGIVASPLVTFGTAGALAIMGFLARFWNTSRSRHLYAACAITLIVGLLHPFEVLVTTAAAVAALVGERRWNGALRFRSNLVLGAATALSLIPHLVLAHRHSWLARAHELNRWHPGPPVQLIMALGMPAVLGLLLLSFPSRSKVPSDGLLKLWFVIPLFLVYMPRAPWSQHFLDGFHYATALLVVLQAGRLVWRRWILWSAAVTLLPLAVCAQIVYRVQSFQGGPKPDGFFSAIMPASEQALIAWLRNHSRFDDLLLAPPERAAWAATVPIHSFASHWLFSLTFAQQRQFSEAFYQGNLEPARVRDAFTCYGIRYVVVPKESGAARYLTGGLAIQRAAFDDVVLYESPGNSMRPYPGPPCGLSEGDQSRNR